MAKIQSFINFAKKELGVDKPVKIKLVGHGEDKHAAFGHEYKKDHESDIAVRSVDRNPVDVMRTVAHELVHAKQPDKPANQKREDEANAKAGRVMRKYDNMHPDIFKEDGGAVGVGAIGGTTSNIPANRTGPGIATFDPLLGEKPLKRKKPRV
jgi:hypothetical protein